MNIEELIAENARLEQQSEIMDVLIGVEIVVAVILVVGFIIWFLLGEYRTRRLKVKRDLLWYELNIVTVETFWENRHALKDEDIDAYVPTEVVAQFAQVNIDGELPYVDITKREYLIDVTLKRVTYDILEKMSNNAGTIKFFGTKADHEKTVSICQRIELLDAQFRGFA